MAYTRSSGSCELFCELLYLAKTVGSECWFPRYKRTRVLSVTPILWLAFWGVQTPAFGQASSNHSGVAIRQRPSASTNATLTHAPRLWLARPGANDDTWTDADHQNNDDWNNPNNWSTKKVPDKTSDVIVNSGTTEQPVVNISPVIHNLTLNAGTVRLEDGIRLKIEGDTISNNAGQLILNSTGVGPATLYIGGHIVTLSGSGSVTMSDSGSNHITGGSGNILINQLSSTPGIQGAGLISGLQLQNHGTIAANAQKNPLQIVSISNPVSNDGNLQAVNGTLILTGKVLNAGGASIQASGGKVFLDDATIVGGALSTDNGGVIVDATDTTLRDLLLASKCQYQVLPNAQTTLEGTIVNSGTISLMGTQGNPAELLINGTQVFLQGSGSVIVNGPYNFVAGSGTLINQETIQASGGTMNVNAFTNQGIVMAVNSNFPFTVQVGPGGVNNTGGTFGTNQGTLNVTGPGPVIGGNFSPDNILNVDNQAMVAEVTINSSGNVNAINTTMKKVTNEGHIQVSSGWRLQFEEAVRNDLEISINAGNRPAAPAQVVINGKVSLTGTGTVTLSGLNNIIEGATGTDTLTNSSIIQGTGIIGNNSMNLVNAGKGVINANSSLPLDISMGPGNLFTNTGSLLVAAITGQSPSVLTLTGPFANFNSSTGTLTGGIYNIAGTFQFDNANVVSNAANIVLAGQIVNQNNVNGLANFATNSSAGRFTLLPQNFSQFTTAGTFTNQGQLSIAKGSQFVVGGTGNYEQAGGKTTVDGTLAVPTGNLVNATAGSLAGAGTFSGSVSIGNPSGGGLASTKTPHNLKRNQRVSTKVQVTQPAGAVATFIIGDTARQAGLVSITNDYSQLLTGVLDVQIGGTTAGSQYSQLNVTSTVSLGGALNIKRINGFVPNIGDTFTILTGSAVSGQFATVKGRGINSSEHFQVNYGATSVTLQVAQGP
jgi:hypothetical protein